MRFGCRGGSRPGVSSGAVAFIQISDGSTLSDLQVVVEQSLPDYPLVEQLTTGASISVQGSLVPSQGRGQKYEVNASRLTVLGLADPETYPLQKKRHTLEFLREIAHLRPRTNTFGAVARIRNATAFAIHSFFQDRGFQYIQTPMITASDAEGAGGHVPGDYPGPERPAPQGWRNRRHRRLLRASPPS